MYKHIPVMPAEVLSYLNCQPGKIFVDGTLGGSGHAKAICNKIAPDGIFIGIDQDIDSISNAKKILFPFQVNTHLINDNFANLPAILLKLGIHKVDGIVLDLGISYYQLKMSGRGFSFHEDTFLDMRMNMKSNVNAGDLINELNEKELADIFYEYGEEKRSKRIARTIIEARKHETIKTSRQLAEIICNAIPKKALYNQKIHPATRVFMALRIAVNKELEMLDSFMANVADLLNPKGRLCVISFHSLEDKKIKHSIREMEKTCVCPPDFPICVCNKKKIARSLTKKPLRPAMEEIALNPMARSAKLRVMELL